MKKTNVPEQKITQTLNIGGNSVRKASLSLCNTNRDQDCPWGRHPEPSHDQWTPMRSFYTSLAGDKWVEPTPQLHSHNDGLWLCSKLHVEWCDQTWGSLSLTSSLSLLFSACRNTALHKRNKINVLTSLPLDLAITGQLDSDNSFDSKQNSIDLKKKRPPPPSKKE